MNRRQFFSSGVAGSVAFLSGRAADAFGRVPEHAPAPPSVPAGSFSVGSRAQLFIDGSITAHSDRIAFTVHPGRKHPRNPLIQADQPWEGWLVWVSGGTVLFDEDDRLFKMWYFSRSELFPEISTHYASSRDGIRWEKPAVGALKVPGYPRHNIVSDCFDDVSVIRDAEATNPAARFKMIGFDHRKNPAAGPRALVSRDGLDWTPLSNDILFPSSDVVTGFHSRQHGVYAAMPKVPTTVRGLRRRCFAITTSPDLLKWSDSRLAFVPDLRDDAGVSGRLEPARATLLSPDDPALMRTEIYGVGVYQAESCVIGLPWVCTLNNRLPSGKDDGVCEIQLASSRDLVTWERPHRVALVPPGPPGAWDCGFVSSATEAFRYGDEIRLYYSGQNFSHGDPAAKIDPRPSRRASRSIGLATWPLDRFVSADGDEAGGRLTTVPLHFTGRRLELNVGMGSRGSVGVEILDAHERPIEGFDMSALLTTDSLRATVAWRGGPDVSRLARQSIRLRFTIRSAQLYSFAFRA
jgi:hypothetical protein